MNSQLNLQSISEPDRHNGTSPTSLNYLPQGNEWAILKALIERGQPTLLAGPTGCGKTTAVESLNRPVLTVVGGTLKTPADLLGRFVLKSGESIFCAGPMLMAMEEGILLYLDEIHDARTEALACLKSIIDHRQSITVNGQVRRARPGFAVIASGVPPFRNLSPELRQRFTFVPFEYLPATKESELIAMVTRLNRADADFLVQVGGCTRQSLKSVGCAGASTRALLQVAQGMVQMAWSRDAAVEQLLWKLAERDFHQTMLQVLIAAGLYSRPSVASAKGKSSNSMEFN